MNTSHQIAIENDWVKVGEHEIEILVPLTDEDEIALGRSLGEQHFKIRQLEAELSDIKKKFKEKIAASRALIRDCSLYIKDGKRPIQKTLPCFFDPHANIRLYVDASTGEIVKSAPAEPGDRQLRFA